MIQIFIRYINLTASNKIQVQCYLTIQHIRVRVLRYRVILFQLQMHRQLMKRSLLMFDKIPQRQANPKSLNLEIDSGRVLYFGLIISGWLSDPDRPNQIANFSSIYSKTQLSKDAYRDQFKPVTFTCKFANGDGQQCGQTFPAILSYLSRYQETSLFRDNFHTISFDFKCPITCPIL